MSERSFGGAAVDRRSDKRERIIEAAIAVFAENGFQASRVSEVAKRAGVADGTIYLYFRNKEDLLLSVFEQKMDLLLAGLDQALAGTDDPREQIVAFARFHLTQVRDNREAAEVLQVELRQSNKFLKEYRPEKLWTYLGVFARIVREGQARGLFRPEVDPFVAMWSFFGALDEIAVQWVLARKAPRFPLEPAADQIAELFVRGLAAQSQPHSEAP